MTKIIRGVAQLGRALLSGGRGRRFKSCHPDQIMITLRNIFLRRGPHLLLKDVNWTIFHKQRIGLIGANGSGKTSLFHLLLNPKEADEGEIFIPPQIKLAHVAQETPALSQSALQFVLEGDTELQALEKKLKIAEEKNDGNKIASLHARLGEIDAYTAPARASQLLNGLSFTQKEQQQPVSDFSGGWRVRLNLAKALMSRSDILLLDEPTNHLDLDAVIWLQDWLQDYQGTLLLISHDRDFLDNIVDHIAYLHHQQLTLYTGNYSTFEKLRAEQLLNQQALYEKQQKKREHLEKFINRFRAKASKARQAQSRIKALERMETVSAVQTESPFQFEFKEPQKCPNPLISLQESQVAYGEKLVLNHLNFSIAPNDRIALLGPNGAGKSSFIKLLAAEITSSYGHYTQGTGLKIGYFAQHQVDHLQLDKTPLDHMRLIAPHTREQELRSFLGGFGFSANRSFEPVHHFSGGEKSRLALALIVWQKPNLLLLDEPTNHLDLEMRQALCLSLQDYEGAMVIVSHDRFLLRATVDQLILVADGKIAPFTGDLNDYEKWLFEYRKKNATSSTSDMPSIQEEQRALDAKVRDERKPLLKQLKELEITLEKLKEIAIQLEIELSNDKLYLPHNEDKLKKLLAKDTEVKANIQQTEEDWLKVSEQL